MDMAALFMKLCHVESRRLLLIIGIAVATVLVFQVFELSSMNILTLSPIVKGSKSTMVGDATILNNSILDSSYVVHEVVNNSDASDLEEADMDYHFASDDDKDLDHSVEMHGEENSDNEFILENGVRLDNSMTLRNVRSTDNSPKETAMELRHGPPEHLNMSNNNFKIGENANSSLAIAEGHNRNGLVSLPLVSSGLSSRGTRNLDADSRTSGLSTVTNVKQVIEAEKYKSTNLSQTVSIPLDNNYTISGISITRRRRIKPMTISQMSSFLFQSAVSSHSVVWI